MDEDLFLMVEEPLEAPEVDTIPPWVILVVDDEPDVHLSTKFALGGLTVLGRRMEFVDAYNGEEACKIVAARNDIHLMFLDCIMEKTQTGFEVAEYIKHQLGRNIPIIVMRSGFSGLNNDPSVNIYLDDYIDKSTAGKDGLEKILNKWLTKL